MKKIGTIIAAVGLVLGSAGTAHAVTVYPAAGGTWDYGNGKVQARSNYYLSKRNHSSSLYRNGIMQGGGVCVRGGSWSYATKYHAPWTGGFAYYFRPGC